MSRRSNWLAALALGALVLAAGCAAEKFQFHIDAEGVAVGRDKPSQPTN